MSHAATEIAPAEEEVLAYGVSDEALEAAAESFNAIESKATDASSGWCC